MSNPRIVWLDVETSGLNEQTDSLLQVAAIVTDTEFNEVHEGINLFVMYDELDLKRVHDNSDPYVQNMHKESGVWDKVITEGIDLSVVDSTLSEYINEHAPAIDGVAPLLGGNSITLDRNFVRENLPKTFKRLSYRSLDMSTIAGFVSMVRPDVPLFKKKLAHDALADIRESIGQAKHYAKFLK